MTEEREKKNRENSERLNQLIVWSFLHHELWVRFCEDIGQGMELNELNDLMDQCFCNGFMELYYMALGKAADIVNISQNLEYFLRFLEISVHKDLTLDLEKIRETINKVKEADNMESEEKWINE